MHRPDEQLLQAGSTVQLPTLLLEAMSRSENFRSEFNGCSWSA